MPEVPAAWAAPGAVAPQSAAAPRPAPTREPQVRGPGGLRPIPLRPMTVLELIDGAIGAVRAVPAALLGWAAALAAALALADFGFTWLFDAAVASGIRAHPLLSTDGYGNTFVRPGETTGSATFGVVVVRALLPIVCSGFAVTLIAGLIAEPIKRYVDEPGALRTGPTAAQGSAPAGATAADRSPRRLMGRLLFTAIVSTLPGALLVALYATTTLAVIDDPQGKWGAADLFLTALGAPLAVCIIGSWIVAAPVVALEGVDGFRAFGRARRLTAKGLPRTAWASLFTLLLCTLVVTPLIVSQYYIGSAHGVGDLLAGAPVSGSTYWWLAAYLIVLALTMVLTSPFRAAVSVVAYIDRRFRREGLDIRIAWARVARGTNGAGNGAAAGAGSAGSGKVVR